MTQDLNDWQDEDFDDFSSDSALFDDFSVAEDPDMSAFTEDEVEESEDEFDRLRRKSSRTGSMFDDMEGDDEAIAGDSSGSSFAFSLSNFSTSQRLILAVLLLLDVLVIGLGILIWMGRI